MKVTLTFYKATCPVCGKVCWIIADTNRTDGTTDCADSCAHDDGIRDGFREWDFYDFGAYNPVLDENDRREYAVPVETVLREVEL